MLVDEYIQEKLFEAEREREEDQKRKLRQAALEQCRSAASKVQEPGIVHHAVEAAGQAADVAVHTAQKNSRDLTRHLTRKVLKKATSDQKN